MKKDLFSVKTSCECLFYKCSVITTGTVCRIVPPSKLVVQMHESNVTRKLTVHVVSPVPTPAFSLDKLPLTETLLDTWATLLSVTTLSHTFKTSPGTVTQFISICNFTKTHKFSTNELQIYLCPNM